MKLTDIVHKDAIVPSLAATDRDEAIRELVDALVASGATEAEAAPGLVEKLLDRERKGSTGFGRGVAVPHVKHRSVNTIRAAVGISQQGIDFQALDKQPVYTIFLLLSPDDRPEEHLQAMETIFKNLSKDTFRRFLRQSDSVEAVVGLLDEADHQQLGG
ncbi:MAG: PTS sugar transporter subunit IIA [Phycisphaerales bacterium]|nr:PTS sugar transporter subunit IIA [Planctomycetota bacterium]MCH8509586.1 PTS sugar transporter subunit IIA [Phycisphaerales bacterium]